MKITPFAIILPRILAKEYFETSKELRSAVLSYVSDPSANSSSAEEYGWPINSWDVSLLVDFREIFAGTPFNEDIGEWNMSSARSLDSMFEDAWNFNQDISKWNVGKVESMTSTFALAASFNQSLSSWNTSSLTKLASTFEGAFAFDNDLFTNVSKVTDFSACFHDAISFNRPLDSWSTISSTSMAWMFAGAGSFNQNIDMFNVSNVNDFEGMFFEATSFEGSGVASFDTGRGVWFAYMFAEAHSFSQDLSLWDVSKALDMTGMFSGAESFGRSLCAWEPKLLGLGVELENMFRGTACASTTDPLQTDLHVGPLCTPCQPGPCDSANGKCKCFDSNEAFHQAVQDYLLDPSSDNNAVAATYGYPINNWCTSGVTSMAKAFEGASDFDEDLTCWVTSRVNDMSEMFLDAKKFNSPLDTWDVSRVQTMTSMFESAESFDQDIGMWQVHRLREAQYLFAKASSFSQDLSAWSPSSLESANGMFKDAVNFNSSGLCGWNVTHLMHGAGMFRGASSFAGDLCTWGRHLSPEANIEGMFQDANSCPAAGVEPILTAAIVSPLCHSCNGTEICPMAAHLRSRQAQPSPRPLSCPPIHQEYETLSPSQAPSVFPSDMPSFLPTLEPTRTHSAAPSAIPTLQPSESAAPSDSPSLVPSDHPSAVPSSQPSITPTDAGEDPPLGDKEDFSSGSSRKGSVETRRIFLPFLLALVAYVSC